jgi:acetyl-CoA/propionyl-CoA carboxylase biotin carboxyl carrier protein
MRRALGEFEVGGITTLIPFHLALLDSEQWHRGETCHDLVADRQWLKATAAPPAGAPPEDDGDEEKVERSYAVEVSGRRFDVRVIGDALPGGGASQNGGGAGPRAPKRSERAGRSSGGSAEQLSSPLQGTILRVATEQGAEVEEGALICVIEAMKMENEIVAHRKGKVEELSVTEGGSVATGDTIAVIK